MTEPGVHLETHTALTEQDRVGRSLSTSPGTLSRADIRNTISQARQQNRKSLDEMFGKRILAAYGIDVPRSARIESAAQLAHEFNNLTPPLVLKVISPDILHKSDVGGVCLNLGDLTSVRAAMDTMGANVGAREYRIDGYLLEEMIPSGHAVVVGGIQDPSFGPLLMFGLGGIFIEVLRDVSFRICPITRRDALEMIHELRGAPILAGARGGIAVSESVLVDTLMAVGGKDGLLLALENEIAELDINPIIVSRTRAVAVDARFVLTT